MAQPAPAPASPALLLGPEALALCYVTRTEAARLLELQAIMQACVGFSGQLLQDAAVLVHQQLPGEGGALWGVRLRRVVSSSSTTITTTASWGTQDQPQDQAWRLQLEDGTRVSLSQLSDLPLTGHSRAGLHAALCEHAWQVAHGQLKAATQKDVLAIAHGLRVYWQAMPTAAIMRDALLLGRLAGAAEDQQQVVAQAGAAAKEVVIQVLKQPVSSQIQQAVDALPVQAGGLLVKAVQAWDRLRQQPQVNMLRRTVKQDSGSNMSISTGSAGPRLLPLKQEQQGQDLRAKRAEGAEAAGSGCNVGLVPSPLRPRSPVEGSKPPQPTSKPSARHRDRSRSRDSGRARSRDRQGGGGRSRSRSRGRHRHGGRSKSRGRGRSRERSRSRAADRGRTSDRGRERSRSRVGGGARSRSPGRYRSKSRGRDRRRTRSRSRDKERHRASDRGAAPAATTTPSQGPAGAPDSSRIAVGAEDLTEPEQAQLQELQHLASRRQEREALRVLGALASHVPAEPTKQQDLLHKELVVALAGMYSWSGHDVLQALPVPVDQLRAAAARQTALPQLKFDHLTSGDDWLGDLLHWKRGFRVMLLEQPVGQHGPAVRLSLPALIATVGRSGATLPLHLLKFQASPGQPSSGMGHEGDGQHGSHGGGYQAVQAAPQGLPPDTGLLPPHLAGLVPAAAPQPTQPPAVHTPTPPQRVGRLREQSHSGQPAADTAAGFCGQGAIQGGYGQREDTQGPGTTGLAAEHAAGFEELIVLGELQARAREGNLPERLVQLAQGVYPASVTGQGHPEEVMFGELVITAASLWQPHPKGLADPLQGAAIPHKVLYGKAITVTSLSRSQFRNLLSDMFSWPERICDERAQAGKSCELMVQRDVHGQGGNCYLTLDVRALVASWCRVRQGG